MGFQQICEDVVRETEDAVGCLVVDLRTGLAVASAQSSAAVLDMAEIRLALRSGDDMFRGKLMQQFAQSLPTNRPDGLGFVREVQVTTPYSYQFMATVPDWDDGIVMLIAEKTMSLGFGWMAVHQAKERLAEAYRKSPEEAQRQEWDLNAEQPPANSPQSDARTVPMESPAPQRSPEPAARNRAPAAAKPAPPSTPQAASLEPALEESASVSPAPAKPEPVKKAAAPIKTDAPKGAEANRPSGPRAASGPRAKMFKPRRA